MIISKGRNLSSLGKRLKYINPALIFSNFTLMKISGLLILARMIEDYLLLRATQVSIFAARQDMINLSAAFHFAVNDGYLISNPSKIIKKFKLPEKQFLLYLEEDMVLFAFNTGMRLIGLITLEWRELNIHWNTINISSNSFSTPQSKYYIY